MKPNTRVYAFFDGVDITAYAKLKSYVTFSGRSSIVEHKGRTSHPDSASGALVTDSNGSCSGSIIIPHNSTLKFKTGSRTFRLTDSSTNNLSQETTSADAIYTARGLLEARQNTITSTKVPVISTTVLGESRRVSETIVSSQ